MSEIRIAVVVDDNTRPGLSAVESGAKSAFASLESSSKQASMQVSSAFDGMASRSVAAAEGQRAAHQSAAGALKENWLAVTAAIAAAVATVIGIIKSLIDQAALAARVETLAVVVNVVGRNAGYSAVQIKGYVDQVKAMGITTQASLTSVTRMAQAHIDLGKASALARIAQDAAVIGNINSSQALETLVHGIQAGEVEVLRTIGINVNFEQSYQKLAQTLGKSTDALSENEKMTARTNAVLAQGKNISGAYAASMDTVGKQALSLSRYSEEAQLKLGELFKPAYAALINMATNALQGMNDKLSELNREGSLAKWGEAGASALLFIGNNAVPIALGGLTMMVATVAKLVGQFEILNAVSKANLAIMALTAAAVVGNEIGQYLASKKPENQALDAANSWVDENRTFVKDRWNKIQKDLDASNIKGIQSAQALAKAIESKEIARYTDASGQTRYKDLRVELQMTKEMIDKTTKGFAEMGSMVDKVGGMNLKFAGNDLSEQIKADVLDMRALTLEYQSLSDTVKVGFDIDKQVAQIDRIATAYSSYGLVIDDVSSNQIQWQKAILEEMKLYETKQSAIGKQTVAVTEAEIKGLEGKLGNYRAYYEDLKKLQKTFYDGMAKSIQDITKLDKDMLASRKTTAALLLDVQNKGNPATNEVEEYNRKASQLDAQYTEAMSMSGEERIKALQDYQRAWAEMVKEVKYTDVSRQLVSSGSGFNMSSDFQDVAVTKTYRSLAESANEAAIRISQAGALIDETQQKMRADAEANLTKQKEAYDTVTESIKTMEAGIKAVESELRILDAQLEKQRTLTIDVSGALANLKALVDLQNQIGSGIGQSAAVPQTSGTSSYSITYDNEPLASYASGTPYAPQTGIYQLHQGEAVKTAEENRSSRSSSSPGQVDNLLGALASLAEARNAIQVIYGMSGQGMATSPVTSGQSTSNYPYDIGSNYAPVLDSYASGTDYVPQTGLYELHIGERVVKASDNARTDSGRPDNPIPAGPSITFSAGAIVINGADKSPEELARLIVKPLDRELKRLGYRS